MVARKTQKLTRFLSGCLYFYRFCQFLQVDYYLRAENSNVLDFVNIVTIAEFTSQVAGPCEGRARNGNKSILV